MRQGKVNRVLPREYTSHSKHPLPTTQETALHMDNARRSILKSDYFLCIWRWKSSIQSAKTRLRADCGSDHEFLIAKFRLKLKKVGKTTRPFRYDLNQIPYNYTVEMTKKFKGLALTQTAWRTMDGDSWHWQPIPVLLPEKSHRRRSLVGCSPWGREESDMTERLNWTDLNWMF